MTNRRGALVAAGVALGGGVGWFISRRFRPPQSGTAGASFTAFAAQPSDMAADRLRKDLDRLSKRVYSEEGIPMFLACENLAPDRTSQQALPVTAVNQHLASAFRRDADAWLRLTPNPASMDVAKILEVLADRDFVSGGTEKSL